MFKFVIQFLIILRVFFYNKKRKGGWFTSSGVLLGLYTVGSLFGIAHLYLGEYIQPFGSSYWMPMLFFDFILLLYLFPVVIFRENEIEYMALPSKSVLDIASIVIIILSFFSIIFFSSSVRNIFSGDDLRAARNALAAGEELYVEAGLANTIASVSASLYVFALLLFFIYYIKGYNKTICYLLLTSSISEPLHVLAYVGRDGVVLWLFTFFFLYSFFYKSMNQRAQKQTRKVLIVTLSALMVPFLAITLSRFSANESGGAGGSIISYVGQGFVNGPLMFGIEDLPTTHGASFPLFYELTGMERTPYLGPQAIGDWVSWTFPTFVGSFVRNFGKGYTLLLGVVLFVFFYSLFGKQRKCMPLHKMIIYLLFLEIYGEGIFYFRHYTRGGNLFILLCFVLYIIMSFLVNYSNKLSMNGSSLNTNNS